MCQKFLVIAVTRKTKEIADDVPNGECYECERCGAAYHCKCVKYNHLNFCFCIDYGGTSKTSSLKLINLNNFR